MSADGDGTPPDRAFWLLSDETRLDVLRTVWAAEAPIQFSEIRSRLGDPDSGRLNYHLGELTGHYLSKSDGGYRLTQAGREVIRAVRAGSITADGTLEPGEIDAECADCGTTLTAEYDEYATVSCPDCETRIMWNEFPPAGLDGRDVDSFARAFDRWTRSRFRLAIEGVCPNCAREMTAELPTDSDDDLAVTHSCGNCRYDARVPLYGYAFDHPAVISLYHERGVDVTAMPFWELRGLAGDVTATIARADPWEARIRVDAGEDSVRLRLDESLAASTVE